MSKKNLGLSEWAQIAEIVGSVAVVISLIFVGLEVRNAAEQLEQASDSTADSVNSQMSLMIGSDPELAALVHRGEWEPEALTPEEMFRFENLALPRLAAWENTHAAYLAGEFSESGWQDWDRFFRMRFGRPGYGVVYEKYRFGFDRESRSYFAEVFGMENWDEYSEPETP